MGRNDDIDLDAHQEALLAGHQLLGEESEMEMLGDEVDEFDQQARLLHRFRNADQLDQKVALRGAKHAALEQQAPFSRIQPPSVLKGSLGNQVTLSNGEFKTVAMWTGDDAETIPVTVTLVPSEQLQSPTAFPTWRPFARIRWGTRGFAGEVFVDVGKGTQFTIACSQIVVDASIDLGAVGTVPAPITMTGMLSFLPVVRTSPLTRTTYIDVPTPAVGLVGYETDDTVLIPPFSKRVWIVAQDSSPAAPQIIEVRALDGAAAIIYNVRGTTATFNQFPLILPDDSVFFELMSVGAGLSTMLQARIIFELQL